jgi:hypothetical protein
MNEQTAETEVYEPPALVEVGGFAELTMGGGTSELPDFLTTFWPTV